MTHSSSALPEGPDGYPVAYESYVSHYLDMVQHHIHQAVSNSKLENPVLLVENHSKCKKNYMGESVLPNGQIWKSQFLVLCICTKVLSDVNNLLKFQNSIVLGPSIAPRMPSLPHLLSSLLRHSSAPNPTGVDYGIEETLLSGDDEEDEYDELPTIRILTKSQYERLTKSQKKEYLDELDYRETLYLKKQLKEEYRRRVEDKLAKRENLVNSGSSDDQQQSSEAFLLPDMVVPPSFDPGCPVHRYRGLATSDQLLVRPVLDSQGWDHDLGFDGLNLETATEINCNIFASVVGQLSKDKHDFSIQSECAACYLNPKGGPSYAAGFDIQSAGEDLIYTVRSNTMLQILGHNITDCGVSLTSFGSNNYIGAKVEDTILVGKRLKFVINGGRMGGSGQVAYGGSIEATLRGGDYPVRNDNVSVTATILSFDKEIVLGGNLLSEFRINRSMKVSVNANLNSRKMGRVCLKISSSEHLQIAFIAAFAIFRTLLCRKKAKIKARR